MPAARSKARSRMEMSTSSMHPRIASSCSDTRFGCSSTIRSKASRATYRRLGSPSIVSIPRSLLTHSLATSSPSFDPLVLVRIPLVMIPFMHSYNSDMAGVVFMIVVSGARSFFTRRGSSGVSVANNLMILMAIQLLLPSTSRSNRRGANGRKSCGLRQPSSHTTLTTAAVTLGSSDSSCKRSLIFGHAGLNVSG